MSEGQINVKENVERDKNAFILNKKGTCQPKQTCIMHNNIQAPEAVGCATETGETGETGETLIQRTQGGSH